MLREDLKVILEIQEYDIQMIRLMRLKREREAELRRIKALTEELNHQVIVKENEVMDLKKQIRLFEIDIQEIKNNIAKLETHQNSVKKVEEFNALTQEISTLEREKINKEQKLSDSYDRLATEEDLLKNLKTSNESSKVNSHQIEEEILASIVAINQEGTQLKASRDALLSRADPGMFAIYERLLKNRRDRVVVPIENRCCSGCHILVTAQHENVVRKGEKIVFCEHCSRIHYWQEAKEDLKQEKATPRRRQRRTSKV
jgi:uncharacterized protein